MTWLIVAAIPILIMLDVAIVLFVRARRRRRELNRRLAIAMVRAYEIADEQERWG